ncbi:MAG: tRNA threonylcarbamoyladenosine dehydratase [Clostridiales bacterium]|nr:tRNA threonylcarbamoyladenosine dehydratase [Clostridiales bacterium]
MSDSRFFRTEKMIGKSGMETLKNSRVAIFGIGGVGGYVAEALARSGVGNIVIVDKDEVDISNLNRQVIATEETIGRAKVDAMRERILSINPEAEVEAHKCFFLPETADEFDFSDYSYVVDAVDTVTAKLEIIDRARARNVPVISSMGAGNKLDPTMVGIADIYDTSICPLARVMRRECKKRGIDRLTVAYSQEPPIQPMGAGGDDGGKPTASGPRPTPGSMVFVPAAMGLAIAEKVVTDLLDFSCETV